MATHPEKKLYSFQQYLTLLQNSEQRMEYDYGEIYVMAGGSSNHATISANIGRALDDALGDDATCVAYVLDRVVKVAEEVIFMPDVVVSCNIADHGEAFLLTAPRIVVEVLSRSTEPRDRTYKLVRYQANEHVQEIIFISQFVQQVEVISRTDSGWDYHNYQHDQSFTLASLDVTIAVSDIYRRLSIPVVAEPQDQ